MRDPVQKNNSNNYGAARMGSANNGGGQFSDARGNSWQRNGRKSDYCWNFNKEEGCSNKHCRWINKCKYCDSTAHGVHVCPKLESKAKRKSGGNRGQHESNERGSGSAN